MNKPLPTLSSPLSSLLVVGMLAIVVGETFAQCIPRSESPYSTYISGVRIGSLANYDQPETERKSAGRTVGYSDYRAIGLAPVKKGEAFEVEVRYFAANYHPENPKEVSIVVWADHQASPGITDAEEIGRVTAIVPANVNGAGIAEQTITVTCTVPRGRGKGNERTLRVGLNASPGQPMTPCLTETGEYEDYAIDIGRGGTDAKRPKATLQGPRNSQERISVVRAVFSESVTGLSPEDFRIVGAEVVSLTGQSRNYELTLEVTSRDTVYVMLPENRAADQGGNGNLASNLYVLSVDIEAKGDKGCIPRNLEPYETYISGVAFVSSGLGPIAQVDPKSENKQPYGYSVRDAQGVTVRSGDTGQLDITYVGTNYDPNEGVDLHLEVWLDANADGVYTPAESLSSSEVRVPANVDGAGLAEHTASLTFTVPDITYSGTTRLRVSVSRDGRKGACSRKFKGEVEDYVIRLEGLDPLLRAGYAVRYDYIPPTTRQLEGTGFEVTSHQREQTVLVGGNGLPSAGRWFVELEFGEDYQEENSYLYFGVVHEDDIASASFRNGTQDAAYLIGFRGNAVGGSVPDDIVSIVGDLTSEHEVPAMSRRLTKARIEAADGLIALTIDDGATELARVADPRREGRYFPIAYLLHYGDDNLLEFNLTASAPSEQFAVEPATFPAVAGRGGGRVELNVIGGQAPFSYTWSDDFASSSPRRSGLAPGTYSYIASEGGGLTRSGEVTVAEVGTVSWTGGGCLEYADNLFEGATCSSENDKRIFSDYFDRPQDKRIVDITVLEDVYGASREGYGYELNVGLVSESNPGHQILLNINAQLAKLYVGGISPDNEITTPLRRPTDNKFVGPGDRLSLEISAATVRVSRNGVPLYESPIPETLDFSRVRLSAQVRNEDNFAAKVRTNFPVSQPEEPLTAVALEPTLTPWPVRVRDHTLPVRFRYRYAGGELRPIRATLTDPRQPHVNLLRGTEYLPRPGYNHWEIDIPPRLSGYYLLTLHDVDYDERRQVWLSCATSGSPEALEPQFSVSSN